MNNLKLIKYKNPNFKMFVTPEFETVYDSGRFEVATRKIFFELLEASATFVDVGGHYGFYSLLASKKIKNGNIFYFEPLKDNLNIFLKSIAENGFKRIKTYDFAVSDNSGEEDFYISESSDLSGFTPHPCTNIERKIRVKTISLDEFFGNRKIDVVKVDTEGHETRVIRGMRKIIDKNSQIKLIFEFNPKYIINAGQDPLSPFIELRRKGFRMFLIDEEGYLIDISDNYKNWSRFVSMERYVNILCVKDEEMKNFLSKSEVFKSMIVKNGKTSIIITCHNYGRYLRQAIISALEQTVKPKEIIVVNDASTDRTEEIARSFADRIRYYKVNFRNSQKARNFGLEKSMGEYVVFLDADDYFDKDFLKYTQAELERDSNLVLVYTDRINLVDENVRDKVGLGGKWEAEDFNYEWLTKGNYISITSLVRKKDFKGFDENIKRFQDWDAWLTLLKNRKAKRINKFLFYVRFHGDNKTLKVASEVEKIKILVKHGLVKLSSEKILCLCSEIIQQKEKIISNKDQVIQQKEAKIQQKEAEIRQKNEVIQQKEAEIEMMRSSKFWKLREKYLKVKNLFLRKTNVRNKKGNL